MRNELVDGEIYDVFATIGQNGLMILTVLCVKKSCLACEPP
jgi:hypothetical protein